MKAAVNRVLAKHKPNYKHMPVPYGYGKSTLDYLICVNGRFLAIETKAPGQRPTDRQEKIIQEILDAGGTVFVIDGTDDTTTLEELQTFLQEALLNATRSSIPPLQSDRRPVRRRRAQSVSGRQSASVSRR